VYVPTTTQRHSQHVYVPVFHTSIRDLSILLCMIDISLDCLIDIDQYLFDIDQYLFDISSIYLD